MPSEGIDSQAVVDAYQGDMLVIRSQYIMAIEILDHVLCLRLGTCAEEDMSVAKPFRGLSSDREVTHADQGKMRRDALNGDEDLIKNTRLIGRGPLYVKSDRVTW